MAKTRTFISFDYDHDSDLKTLLVAQSKIDDSPFEIIDMSIKDAISYNWKDKVRTRIKRCDVVVVICGAYTDSAAGVTAELRITQEEDVDYFLLNGRSEKTCIKPMAAKSSDKIYTWTWDNLKALLGGHR